MANNFFLDVPMNAGTLPGNDADARNRESSVLCSVCIGTFRRPHLLKKLLASLERQELPAGVDVEVIVVDNDSRKSADAIVANCRSSERIRFSYFQQPVKNISLTRNLAVEKASGEYLLFIDDDEVAPPEWISCMMEARERFDADGVFGPVMPEFHSGTPPWMRQRDLFYGPMQGTGDHAIAQWTGNCMVHASHLKKLRQPFAPEYGITGGEDSHLFDRLARQGARFVYCREGWVTEYIPPLRTTIRYLFLRGLKNGHGDTRRKIDFAGKKHLGVRFFMVAKAVLYGTISLVLMVISFPSPVRRTHWLMKFASNLGRCLAAFGWQYQHYR